ncbi:MAG TPA: Nif3-like dinuclear metal center hexameric protein [Polyangiaceae bacterium]|jgi:dinuclear metal center YbgI/SA1388 family protein|nr:Nif3-like dinuclear metal center hexameric protein [Polyangiaceae bacterium]
MTRTLADVVALLERFAPLALAEDWDNVGLLIEPSGALEGAVKRLFLCIDLSEAVLTEAIDERADLCVSYHPPLFKGVKRLRISAAEERVIVRALEAKLPVYSPHTALDAADDGVNDWLLRGLGSGKRSALVPHVSTRGAYKLVVFVPRSHVAELRGALSNELGAGAIGNYSECSYELDGRGSFFGNKGAEPQVGARGQLEFVDEVRLEMRCEKSVLKELARVIGEHHPYEEPAWDVYPLAQIPNSKLGAGRLLELDQPISLLEAVARLKAHLGLPTLRVASSGKQDAGAPIRRVAICAGAGGSLFERVNGVDLFVTGEMRHHDVLAKTRAGASVILSEHTHTERGFLPEFAARLNELSGGELDVIVSARDADPLRTL